MTTRRQRTRQSWWRIGLVLVTLLLGHDVFMASPVQAADHHGTPKHHIAAAVADSAPDSRDPAHPAECGITFPAIPASVDQLDTFHAGALGEAASSPCAALRLSPFLWEEPARPPGVRRALLQVYRI